MRVPALVAAAVLAASSVAFAASPAPKPAPAAAKPAAPQRIDVQKLQPKDLAPKTPLHVEYIVEVNKLGQVARVRSVKPSHNVPFDTHTYGNTLQAFIRTDDGKVVLGTYRLTYDYDPKTLRVRRDVALVKRGGVDPNAKGAAADMSEIAARNGKKTPPPGIGVTPGPVPSVTIRRMPDLPQVMRSPSPAPH